MNYWSFLGIVYLGILCYQDIRHKQLVDDRFNYFMMGATVGLVTLYKYNVWLLFLQILVISALMGLISYKKLMGSADIKTIMWTFTGFCMISMRSLLYFGGLFVLFMAIAGATTYIIGRVTGIKIERFAAYPMIFGAFLIAAVFYT